MSIDTDYDGDKCFPRIAHSTAPTQGADDPLEITPHTKAGFAGAFYAQRRRAPTDQEFFDAGVRSGLARCADDAQPVAITDEKIRAVFMAHGFTVKEGQTDLKPYVYAAARALLATRDAAPSVDDAQPVAWAATDEDGKVAALGFNQSRRFDTPLFYATRDAAPIDAPMQPLTVDKHGTVRFKENAIVRHLLDKGGIDMNALAVLEFRDSDREQFAQLIGYSVSGYGELSYVSDESYDRAAAQVDRAIAASAPRDK